MNAEHTRFVNIKLNRAFSRLKSEFSKTILQPESLTIQEWRTLYNIWLHGDCHLRELARLAYLDPAHVSKVNSSLRARGLICVNVDEHDRRLKRITLTPKGIGLVQIILPQFSAFNDKIKVYVGEDRFHELCDTLDTIIGMPDSVLTTD